MLLRCCFAVFCGTPLPQWLLPLLHRGIVIPIHIQGFCDYSSPIVEIKPKRQTQTKMAESGKADDLDTKQTKGVPAWKLREQMKSKEKPIKDGSSHSISKLRRKSVQTTVDPNLPPAFRAAFTRAAFQKQQQRRKNNDEFVSLNSSHPTPSTVQMDSTQPDTDDDSDLSSFGGDSFGEVEEGDEDAGDN